MKKSLLNYQFFKSYRLPLDQKDRVYANVESRDYSYKKCKNVKVESINLSGFNFISPMRFNIGEELDISIFTNHLFNNWDFTLKGNIVRSFISENDTEKIVYGVLLNKQDQDSILSYFLKDFIGKYNKNGLKEHLIRACVHDRKILSSEGVELFSLFTSITNDIYQNDRDHFLNGINNTFNCEYQYLIEYSEQKSKFEIIHSNNEYNILKSDLFSSLDVAFSNEILVNTGFKEKSENSEIYNLIAHPILNRHQKPVALIVMANTYSKQPFDNSDEVTLRLNAQIISFFYRDHGSAIPLERNHFKKTIYENLLGESKNTLELKHTLEKLKNTDKNVLVLGERGTKKEEIANYLHNEGKDNHRKIKTIDFNGIDKTNLFFTTISDLKNEDNGTLIVEGIHNLDLTQQKVLYDNIRNLKCRIVCLTNKEIYYLVKKGKFLKKLYFHIADIYLHLAPLRNRQADILDLARYILNNETEKREMPEKVFSKESEIKLQRYYWPENLKQLSNEIKKAVIKSPDEQRELNLQLEADKVSTKPEENAQLYRILKSVIYHSDKSVYFKGHSETLHYLIKNKKVG